MTMTLSDIRFILSRELGDEAVDIPTVINWCNFCHSDIGVRLNVPATATIALNTTALKYAEPAGIKQINRLWLQSDYDNGINADFMYPYRRYNGFIWLDAPYAQVDTLNIDYFKDLRVFADILDPIDIDDRYHPIYVYFAKMKYYLAQKSPEHATRSDYYLRIAEVNNVKSDYSQIKNELISYYSMKNPDYVVKERW